MEASATPVAPARRAGETASLGVRAVDHRSHGLSGLAHHHGARGAGRGVALGHGPQSLLFGMDAASAAATKRPSPSRTSRGCSSASGVCKSPSRSLPSTFNREAYRRASHARERQGGFRAFVRRQPKHQAGGTTAQPVLDARRVPLDREPLRPLSKQRQTTPRSGASQSCRAFASLRARCSAAAFAAATSSLCFAIIRLSSSPLSADISWTSSTLLADMITSRCPMGRSLAGHLSMRRGMVCVNCGKGSVSHGTGRSRARQAGPPEPRLQNLVDAISNLPTTSIHADGDDVVQPPIPRRRDGWAALPNRTPTRS